MTISIKLKKAGFLPINDQALTAQQNIKKNLKKVLKHVKNAPLEVFWMVGQQAGCNYN